MSVKMLLKQNKLILWLYESLFQRPIYNLYKKEHSKKVLISYSTYHFKKSNYLSHSNYQESKIIADIFDELGFQVDVINNNKPFSGDFCKYDVIFGEGVPLFQASHKDCFRIYYGTGSHPLHCTNSSISRLVEFSNKYPILPTNSLRVFSSDWAIAASVANAVICIGNEKTRQTFVDNGVRTVLTVDPSFHPVQNAAEILANKNIISVRKTALWFGSYGLLHKGLDLAVEAFRDNPDWTLHVCGHTEAEKDLIELINPPRNVKIHGFLDISSDYFRSLALECGFVILPSCSEGTATAVLTAVGNGAMIPIVSDECGFDIEEFGFSVQLNKDSISNKMKTINSIPDSNLFEMAEEAYSEVNRRYTLKNFSEKMRSNIRETLESNRPT